MTALEKKADVRLPGLPDPGRLHLIFGFWPREQGRIQTKEHSGAGMSFLGEIKRRKIFQVAAAYAGSDSSGPLQ